MKFCRFLPIVVSILGIFPENSVGVPNDILENSAVKSWLRLDYINELDEAVFLARNKAGNETYLSRYPSERNTWILNYSKTSDAKTVVTIQSDIGNGYYLCIKNKTVDTGTSKSLETQLLESKGSSCDWILEPIKVSWSRYHLRSMQSPDLCLGTDNYPIKTLVRFTHIYKVTVNPCGQRPLRAWDVEEDQIK